MAFLDRVAAWFQQPGDLLAPALLVLLIGLAAFLVQLLARRLIGRLARAYRLPREFVVGARRVTAFVIYTTATLIVLERLGVSGAVLWTAFTGFAAVAAVAFFAAWSVLSNIFCTMLIFATRPFRRRDHFELLESVDPQGDVTGSVLQVPNNLFFQRTLRRWTAPRIPAPWLGTPPDQPSPE